MTVKQLIELLQTLPQDLPVYLADWSEGYMPDVEIGHEENGRQLLPYIAEACALPTKWDLPRRVVIG